MLQAVGDGLELVCSFFGELVASTARAQFVRIVKDGAQAREVHRVGKLFEFELVFRRNLVGPACLDPEDVGVAGDMQRRVFERRGVAGELFQRLVEIALLLLVFPGEISLLPDVGPAFAAAGRMSPTGSSSTGVGWPNRRQRSMKCSCAVARSVSATGFHLRMNSCGVIVGKGEARSVRPLSMSWRRRREKGSGSPKKSNAKEVIELCASLQLPCPRTRASRKPPPQPLHAPRFAATARDPRFRRGDILALSCPRQEAVGKLQRVFTRTYFVRFFEPWGRLEAKISRKISLCAIVCKISLSFRTASPSGHPEPRRYPLQPPRFGAAPSLDPRFPGREKSRRKNAFDRADRDFSRFFCS